jgi:hypothetical protein
MPVAFWCAYVVAIGGDVFPAWRHFTPIVVGLCLILAVALAELDRHPGRARSVARAASGVGLLLLVGLQLVDPQNQRAREERWEWDGEVVGRLLGSAFAAQQPLLAVDAAGAVPFFAKLPALDMLGLTDRALARKRPPDFGAGALGHELGDGAYVLGREPDLVLFCLPTGGAQPCFRSGIEMLADPRFAARYRLIQLEGDDPRRVRTQLWARAEGGRIGIERTPTEVVVPAWFATGAQPARLGSDGRLRVEVAAGAPASVAALALERGLWRVTPLGIGPAPRVSTAVAGSRRLRGREASALLLVGSGMPDLQVDVVMSAGAAGEPFALERLRFERVPLAAQRHEPGAEHEQESQAQPVVVDERERAALPLDREGAGGEQEQQ